MALYGCSYAVHPVDHVFYTPMSRQLLELAVDVGQGRQRRENNRRTFSSTRVQVSQLLLSVLLLLLLLLQDVMCYDAQAESPVASSSVFGSISLPVYISLLVRAPVVAREQFVTDHVRGQ
jgi:hypothetical protein